MKKYKNPERCDQAVRDVIQTLREKSKQEQNKISSFMGMIGGSGIYLGRAKAYEDAADLLEKRLNDEI